MRSPTPSTIVGNQSVGSATPEPMASLTAISIRAIRNRSRSESPVSRRHMSGQTEPKVRLVLFDVFDTLCTPRDSIHIQYYEEAIRAGIAESSITPESVRAGFKPAFKSMDAEYPLYGKHATPSLFPEQWWTELIRRCIKAAGAEDGELERCGKQASSALLDRFESDRGYRAFSETIETLKALKNLGVKTSVVSNADPRILKTLEALQILPQLSYPPVLSWDVEASKPSSTIFSRACELCDEEAGQGVIMIGDELKADYNGAHGAGLEARLIRRVGEWSDGAARRAGEDLTGVTTIQSLTEVVTEVRRRNKV